MRQTMNNLPQHCLCKQSTTINHKNTTLKEHFLTSSCYTPHKRLVSSHQNIASSSSRLAEHHQLMLCAHNYCYDSISGLCVILVITLSMINQVFILKVIIAD